MKFYKLIWLTLLVILSCYGYKNKNGKVYWTGCNEGQGSYQYELIGADSNYFTVLKDSDYAKDNKYAYYKGSRLNNVQVEHFQSIGNGYAKDRNKVFFSGRDVEGAHALSFEALQDSPYMGKDKTDYYNQIHKLNVCHFESFRYLTQNWSKDNLCVYGSSGDKLESADPETFEIMNYYFTKDKNNVYFFEKKINGADPASFKVSTVDKSYASDNKKCFIEDEIIDCKKMPAE
ncbi:MAG: DKNYY domain-containing protein [Spirochaetia bacterium]|nr:DKNYY domain-containing protein [Spirochaetia bacterium]